MFNQNTLHNVINAAIAILAALIGMDWTSFVSPDVALKVIAGLSTLKLVMNGFRDGLVGMTKEQPPVKK